MVGPGALCAIDEQIAEAEKVIAGKTPVKRNRFIQPAAHLAISGRTPRQIGRPRHS